MIPFYFISIYIVYVINHINVVRTVIIFKIWLCYIDISIILYNEKD